MKKIFTFFAVLLLANALFSQYYSTCVAASSGTALSNGGCINNLTFPGSANMSGLCVGGNNPAVYIKFVAGSCSQFKITPSSSFGTVGSAIYTSPGCGYVANSAQCHDNVVSGVPFMADCHNITGGYLLTSGQTYILQLWGAVGTSIFNICYSANATEATSNECSGAINLGAGAATFFNGGDCSFTGSYTDATTSDPAASALCAGSLENTQWIRFQPLAGVTSFQIIGSNINCTGGGCGFQFGIFSGSCGSLLSEGCYGNKVCAGGQSVAGPTNVSSADGFIITWSGTSTTGFTATITRTGGGAFTGSEVFYLVMDGNSDADCTYTLQGINIQPLPVELLSFEGFYDNNNITLNWSTASETNSSYFGIEKMTNTYGVVEIGKVTSAGNSNTLQQYSFIDYNVEAGHNYYRLVEYSNNGDVKTYDWIVVDANADVNDFCCKEYYTLQGQPVKFENLQSGIYIGITKNSKVIKIKR